MAADRVGPSSRRELFVSHGGDARRAQRCPVCRWAVEQDHAEALAMQKTFAATLVPVALLTSERDAEEAAAVTGFALA